MNATSNNRNQQTKFLKLSLKKNKLKCDEDYMLKRSSDVIILDESLDKLSSEIPKRLHTKIVPHSPIVINDSSEHSDEGSRVDIEEKEPSKYGNVSFNKSEDNWLQSQNQPSIEGWSPSQNILTATPRINPIPTTPKDVANESYEQCSIKKIHQSQKKILTDLYGDTWKSIPKLIKTISQKYDKFDGITKKLFDDDEDKENIRHELKKNRELYLTSSDVKKNVINFGDTEKKSKKKLYTEKVPSTPDVNVKQRNVNSTTKKVKIKKGLSVTELVQAMGKDDLADKSDYYSNKSDDLTNKSDNLTKKDDNSLKSEIDKPRKEKKVKKTENVDDLLKRIESVTVTPSNGVNRLSFMGSLADNVPSWRCHPEAIQYIDNYKSQREQLTGRLYKEFNKNVFDNGLDADMIIVWDSKLRSTAGTTTNRLIATSSGARLRSSSIKLSTKVLDSPQRLRDTLIHEMCHAATWVIDHVLRAAHGPLWKKWATRALHVYPELGEISRCHDLQIHFKYSYKCTQCGYTIQRHSKSIDVAKKCCGYCHGTFALVLNRKNKDGVLVTTPARKASANGFAQFVKENYATVKNGGQSHAQVMKLLGEQFSAKKAKPVD